MNITRHRFVTLAPGACCLALAACANPVSGPRQIERGSSDTFTAASFYFDFDDVYVGSVRTNLNESLTQIDKAISDGADILIINLVSSGNTEQADTICQTAEAAGIPVVFFNRPVEAPGYEGMILNYYDNVAYVGTDAEQSGRLQGQMIGDYLVEHFSQTDLNGDGKITYALFKGQAGNIGADYRTKYSVEVANEVLANSGYPELVYFDESSIDHFQLDLTGSWSLESARDYMKTDLLYYNEDEDNMIELVIANSDAMAEGAIEALQAFGYNDGDEGHTTIPVFGVDASESGKRPMLWPSASAGWSRTPTTAETSSTRWTTTPATMRTASSPKSCSPTRSTSRRTPHRIRPPRVSLWMIQVRKLVPQPADPLLLPSHAQRVRAARPR